MISALVDVASELVPWLVVLGLGAWAIRTARTDGNRGLIGELRRERGWRECVRRQRGDQWHEVRR